MSYKRLYKLREINSVTNSLINFLTIKISILNYNIFRLIFLAKHQFGNYVVQSMMNKASKDRRINIRNMLKENAPDISSSQYGRHVLLQLEKNRIK